MEQALKPSMRKPSYIKMVEEILYEYPTLKAAYENEKELEKAGLGSLFPSMTPVYEERTSKGYSEYQSETERYGILRAARHARLNCIERALDALTQDERRLIEERYFSPFRPTDQLVYERVGLSRGKYHQLKRKTMTKLAVMLHLI